MNYHHTQMGVVIIAAMAVAIGIMLFLPFPITVLPFAVLAIAVGLALFYSLTIEINENELTCSFGVGIIRRRIPLSEIQQVEIVNNSWLMGWGIHWNPGRYWLWNVSGFRAVELTMKGGKRFRLGTDDPEALVNAIVTNKR